MRNLWLTRGLCVAILVGMPTARPALAANGDDKLPDDARTALLKSGELELIQLWPYDDRDPKPGKDFFHGYEVSNRVTLKGKDARKLSAAVVRGIAEGGDKALCFDPHHGIRAVYEGKTYDFVICFRCKQIVCYSPKGGVAACVETSDSPRKTLDLLLHLTAKPTKDKDDK